MGVEGIDSGKLKWMLEDIRLDGFFFFFFFIKLCSNSIAFSRKDLHDFLDYRRYARKFNIDIISGRRDTSATVTIN